VCRQYDGTSASSVTFNEIESSLYKRRRLHQPTLPRSATEVPQIMSTSRFAANNDALFYRGNVEFTGGSAVYFATAAQIDLMKTADKAFVDGT